MGEQNIEHMEQARIQSETLEEALRSNVEQLQAKNDKMEKELEEFNSKAATLESRSVELEYETSRLIEGVSTLQDPPRYHVCVHRDYTSTFQDVLTYSNLLFSSSNVEVADFNLDTGSFTSGFPGTYTVTWSLLAHNDYNDHPIFIVLRKNGKRIWESETYSQYTGASGIVYEQGGRTLMLHLDSGDFIDLYCQNCDATIYDVTFCISLTSWENNKVLA